jgi:hypothetical protein
MSQQNVPIAFDVQSFNRYHFFVGTFVPVAGYDIYCDLCNCDRKTLDKEEKRQSATYKVDSSCKKPLVICNSIFSIFLNQIKAQRDLKIIVWIEYFPYKYSFKVISND